MQDKFQILDKKLSNLTGLERLEVLLQFLSDRNIEFDEKLEAYFKEAFKLAEQFDQFENEILLYHYQAESYRQVQKIGLGLDCYLKALKLSQKIDNPTLLGKSLLGTAQYYYFLEDQDNAQIYYKKGIKQAKACSDGSLLVWGLNGLAGIYGMQLLYDKAVALYLEAIEVAKENNFKFELAFCYYNVSACIQDDLSGIDYLEKALPILRDTKVNDHVIRIVCRLTERYLKINNVSQSKKYALEAIAIADESSNHVHTFLSHSKMLEVLLAETKFIAEKERPELLETAVGICEKLKISAKESELPKYISYASYLEGQLEYFRGDFNAALDALIPLIPVLNKEAIFELDLPIGISEYLYKTYQELGDFENAFKYYKIFEEWNKKSASAESAKHAQALQAKFESKEKEAEVNRLKELEEIKGKFFSQITHELRTPLTLILGPAKQIIESSDLHFINNHAAIIERNANRLLRLVNQLLDINKLEAGKMDLNNSRGNLIAFIEFLVQSFQNVSIEKQIQFDFVNQIDDLLVSFDADKIEKIVFNLLSNAFKFTPNGGRILLELTDGKSNLDGFFNILIQVVDSGRGISKKELPFIFDPFYQADNSLQREAEGTGIGLALVKELVDLMNGEIDVKSSVGKGTHFIISLNLELVEESDPETNAFLNKNKLQSLIESNPDPKTEAKSKPSISPANAPVLLLVEDNPDMRTYIQSLFEDNYIVVQAFDGEDGLTKAIDRIPDIIVSDVMMPKKDGYQLCKEIKEDIRTSHIPFILLTAKTALPSRLEGLGQGADAYLSKPFSPEELKLQIVNLLNTQNNLQKKYNSLDALFAGSKKKEEKANKETKFLEEFVSIIEENIDDETLGVDQISSKLFMSHSQLYRKVKALTDLTATEFIRNIRLTRAKTMLENKEGNVSEIAGMVGLSAGYFSKSFTKLYGYSPKKLL